MASGTGTGTGGSNTKADHHILHFSHNHRGLSHHCHHYFSGVFVKITVLFVTLELVFLVLNQTTYPTRFFQKDGSTPGYLFPISTDNTMPERSSSTPFHLVTTENMHSLINDENILESTLKKASMEDNKTVIITTLNASWTEPNSIFDLFLESFRLGNQTRRLLNNLMVVALDRTAYSRCQEIHLNCYALTPEGVDFSGPAHFMSSEYLKMMWRRINFLRSVLELGYNFIFTDADVMWLRDPFPRFYPDADFQISCDHYLYNSTNLKNYPNGGFNYVKANNRTIRLYKFWYTAKDYFPGKHDQDVFNRIKFNPFLVEIGLKMRFLDTATLAGSANQTKILIWWVTMHANCCVGVKNKIHDIKMVIDDWKNYMALPSGDGNLSYRSWTSPWICGWVRS